jgi:hypothetical protein
VHIVFTIFESAYGVDFALAFFTKAGVTPSPAKAEVAAKSFKNPLLPIR